MSLSNMILPCLREAYFTKSGLRVFGFCPAGSTSKVGLTVARRGVNLECVS